MQTPIRILCLDDDSIVLEMLKEFLVAEGHTVLATTSADEARKALDSEHPFTFCICDYQMPEMLGDDFLRLVAMKSPGTIRVLMSGYADNKRINQAKVERVCSTFIQKPFRVADLIEYERRAAEPAVDARCAGIGILAEHQNRIFEPFVQADSSGTPDFEGIGLGLAIARRMVELMGGTISVQSDDGTGSSFTFSFLLPVAGCHGRGEVKNESR